MLSNGLGTPLEVPRFDSILKVKGGREYRVIFDIEGLGFTKIWMVQFDAGRQVLKQSKISSGVERIMDLVLSESVGEKRVSRRFLTLPEAAYVRFGIEHVVHSRVTIKKAILESLANETR